MKKIILTFLVLISFLMCTYANNPGLDVTYIGNEGFLVQSANHRILIDALFKSGAQPYLAPTKAMVKKMIKNEEPYNDIDLLLITHRHMDNFNAPLTIKYLINNPNCKLIAHSQVVCQLKKWAKFAEIESQIKEIDSNICSKMSLKENGIEIDVLNTRHSFFRTDRENLNNTVFNLAFIVNLDGEHILHMGGSVVKENILTLEKYPFAKKPIDVLFLTYFDIAQDSKQFITNKIKPKSIVAMHIPYGMESNVSKFIKTHYHNTHTFKHQQDACYFENGGKTAYKHE